MSFTVIYALEEPPESYEHAIFLAGPTPRKPQPLSDLVEPTPSWRPEALKVLETLGYDGVVFVPEPRSGDWAENYDDQASWEQRSIKMSDTTVFWVPRNLTDMPALTTNVEFGRKVDHYNLVLGAPPNAEKIRYLEWLGSHATRGNFVRHFTLEDTLRAAIASPRALRSKGERYVPAQVFKSPAFQAWYQAQLRVGNRLEFAEVLWKFMIHKVNFLFGYVVGVHVWIEAEQRFKVNEFIFSRTDTFMTVLFSKPAPGDFLDTEIVLVKEFRSPVRNSLGFVYEVPGGSSFKPGKDPLEVASSEVFEECGLQIDPSRFYPVGSRQVGATLSTHHAHVFACELTADEIAAARADTEVHGVEADTERTYVEVRTLREILSGDYVDWATIGMIYRAAADCDLVWR